MFETLLSAIEHSTWGMTARSSPWLYPLANLSHVLGAARRLDIGDQPASTAGLGTSPQNRIPKITAQMMAEYSNGATKLAWPMR